jgi:hypothetical protein
VAELPDRVWKQWTTELPEQLAAGIMSHPAIGNAADLATLARVHLLECLAGWARCRRSGRRSFHDPSSTV